MTCQNSNKETYIVLLTLMLMTFDAPITLYAERNYLFEFGPKVGISIFAQDPIDKNLTPHLAYGGDLRYKFDTRWAVCAGVTATDIRFTDRQDNTYKNNLIMVDAKGEFNFFKLNRGWVDRHSRSWSPYLMAGLGISIQTQGSPIHGYMPFGFGLKWKMAERLSFNVAWQVLLRRYRRCRRTQRPLRRNEQHARQRPYQHLLRHTDPQPLAGQEQMLPLRYMTQTDTRI